MKKDANRLIEQIDDKYIIEANPKKAHTGSTLLKRVGGIAAMLVLIVSLVLVTPYSKTAHASVREYRDSEYFELISTINSYRYESGRTSLWRSTVFPLISLMINGAGADIPELDGSSDEISGVPNVNTDYYEEVTDNQVEGVIESDIFKSSSKYIFHLVKTGQRDQKLKVYTKAGEQSEHISTYYFSNEGLVGCEMYLSSDASRLTVIGTNSKYTETTVISLDVSDVKAIKEVGRKHISGHYGSSRMVNGELLLLTKFSAPRAFEYDDYSTYIPSLDGECLSPDEIVIPNELTCTSYTVLCKFSEVDLELIDKCALLSYSDTVYVSADNVYVSKQYQKSGEQTCDIVGISYTGDTFEEIGTATVRGKLLNQYSLDEYDGVLRAVTTTDKKGVSNASLWCIAIDGMELLASVEDFAPSGESVRSVRFDGTAAYVCTAIEVKDPVFFFDLSDIDNITYTDTGTIPGFSTSLINMGGGYLLGIGDGGFGAVKVEVYKEDGGKVVSVCSYLKELASVANDYKSYYVNRAEGLIGVPYRLNVWETSERDGYVLLKFENETLTVVLDEPIYHYANTRALLDDGYFYILDGKDLSVYKIK